MKDTNQIDQFLAFARKAQTRAGVPFKLKSYQRGQDGSISSAKGTVTIKTEGGSDIDVESIWDITTGKSYAAPGFDLIEDCPIEE